MNRILTLALTLAAGTALCVAQPTRVRELQITDGGSTVRFVAPKGLTQPVIFDLSGLSDCINATSPGVSQAATFTTKLVDGKIVFGVQKAEDVETSSAFTRNDLINNQVDMVNQSNSEVCDASITIPVMKEFESFTAHVSCSNAKPGSAFVATPLQHLPEGFLVAYATCVQAGIVDIKLINVAGVCSQPTAVPFAVGIIKR